MTPKKHFNRIQLAYGYKRPYTLESRLRYPPADPGSWWIQLVQDVEGKFYNRAAKVYGGSLSGLRFLVNDEIKHGT